MSLKRFSRSQKGMSLVEVAIVFGIAGVVMAGIWAVYASSRESLLASEFHQQTVTLVKQVRDYYAGRALPTAVVASATLTASLRTGEVFPEDMCAADCVAAASGAVAATVRNAYGGATTANIPDPATTPNTVEVVYAGVRAKGCIQLALQLSARSDETGLTSFKGNSHLSRTTFPVSLSQAKSDCDGAGDSNTVTLRFKIRN